MDELLELDAPKFVEQGRKWHSIPSGGARNFLAGRLEASIKKSACNTVGSAVSELAVGPLSKALMASAKL